MTPDRNEPGRSAPVAGLTPLGLDDADSDWLERVRRAARAPALGRLGEYELLEEVNRGAQGVVYRARRADGGDVAVKRLLAGTLSGTAARARFERERETAAALKHPNIVRWLADDSTDRHPLLVMEWIDGVPIDRWADRVRQSSYEIGDLLKTFREVCSAVHHAHQRGVIHRDLKPSNILVDGLDRPHLLDFGLAKLIGPSGERESTVTRTHDFLGTPAYAAPEQVRGDHEAVDVRSDVYALGVILFRVLTGRLPFDSSRRLADLLADIQEARPGRPSRWNRALDDDLDAIVAKAMARDTERRYASVDAFDADLARFLAREPIDARRGRRWYEMRTALRRHRTAVGVLAIVLVIVSSAALALWRMYLQQGQLLAQVTAARDAESKARRSAQRQQSMLEELLAAAAEIGKGADLAVRRAWLDQAAKLVEADLGDDPSAQAAAHDAIARTYQSLALYSEAESHLQTALKLRRATHEGDHADLARSLQHLGSLLQDRNRFADAELYLQDALAMRRRLFPGDHDDLIESLESTGLILQFRKDYDAAEDVHLQAMAMNRRLHGNDDPRVAYDLDLLGTLRINQARFRDAETAFREALRLKINAFGDDHREVAATKTNLAKALFHQGAYDEAETLFRESIAASRRLLGDEHDNVAWGLHRLGILLHAAGRHDDAESALRESLAIYRRCFGDRDHYVALVLDSLGALLLDRDDPDAARFCFDEALDIRRPIPPADSPRLP